MKKYLNFLAVLSLAACAGTTSFDNGLNRLDKEPTNCEYLYALDSNFTSYNINDAYDYVEKSILDQNKHGDSYYVVNENILKNKGAIFGPKNTYKIKVKVYNCKK